MRSPQKLFILDTNVLIHDPGALFRFAEHNIYLPLVVLEELDNNKVGHSEVARNARQVSRFLDELIQSISLADINQGIPLSQYYSNKDESQTSIYPTGKLFFQTKAVSSRIADTLAYGKVDNTILNITHALNEQKDVTAILVSKDINLRIKAAALSIYSEDYNNDKVLDDLSLLYAGTIELDNHFWEQHDKGIKSWHQEGKTFYDVHGEGIEKWYPKQFIYIEEQGFEAQIYEIPSVSKAILRSIDDYQKKEIWGITARNREQNYALNLLMDTELDFVSLLGQAGTGKTLLTLAAGLQQVIEEKHYHEIIMTRITIPVGEDIGFLPGTEEEKMEPWMGALMDNLEVLLHQEQQEKWSKEASHDYLKQWIKIRSLNFMRGRTFLNRYIIIDEAQNLTPKQMKTLITRAGPGSKIVCLGNVAQIDTPYLTETSSGLTYVVDRFKHWPHSGHLTLRRGERSRLADYAASIL